MSQQTLDKNNQNPQDHQHHHNHHHGCNHDQEIHDHSEDKYAQEERERIMHEKEEKMIRRPILGRTDSQTDSDQSSGHDDTSSDGSQENNNQDANLQTNKNSKHSKGEKHNHNHHKHDHSHDHDHSHQHGSSCNHTHNKNVNNNVQNPVQNNQNKSAEQTPKNQSGINPQTSQNTRLASDITVIRQSSINREEQKIVDDIYIQSSDRNRVIDSDQYSQKLKNLIKNCFHTTELDNLDGQFNELQKLLTEIQQYDISIFDQPFFKKIILLAQLDNPRKCLKIVALFKQLFNDNTILNYLLKLPDSSRLIVDLINSYYILLEKYKNTEIELDLKLQFNTFQNILDSQGHYEEFKELVEKQTTLQSLNTIELTTDQKEIFEMIRHYSKFKEVHQKEESIKYIVLLLGKCDTIIQQYKIMVYHLTPIFVELSNANFDNNEIKVTYINQVLDLIDRYIFPIEFLINFDTTRIQGIKTYYLKNLKQIVQKFTSLYTLVGGFLNSVLLMPQEIQLNLRALFMIRRMYYFFYEDLTIRSLMEGPIEIILGNLAMFTRDVVQRKEPTLFLHKLLEDNNTLPSLREKLEANEYISSLKQNKYFGVMAKSYPLDIDVQYNFKNLNFQVNYPVYKKIESGQFFFYNIHVTKPDTIIYWSFKTLDYDIKFGLFKMDTLSNELQIDSYEEERQIKAIVKLQKADSHKKPVMAYSLVSLPGFYRIVFDNTYSYWREKELLYTIQVLEL